jgi:DNA-binding MarR family transcriptional regulator
MGEHPRTSPERPVGDRRSSASAPDGLAGAAVYDVDSGDPQQVLIDRRGMAGSDVRQISELMAALGELRAAEEMLSEASRRYMRLNETDMRALHYLIVCAHQDLIATPGGISHHLRISSASTTKLLDRLEHAGHITRAPHPTDRRALTISITPETHQAAMETVGRQQSKRFYAAARLTPAERDVVIRFLRDMAQEITPGDEPWAQHSGE